MRIDLLPEQSPINAVADGYAARCLELSRAVEVEAAAGHGPVLIPDIAFGPFPGQGLDLWLPRAGGQALPVVLFFHGGNFTHGFKEWASLMAPAVTGAGAILVACGYRLAPANTYRGIIGDAFAALSWARANIATHGGDPGRILLAGHSAGGQIAVEMALRHDRRAEAGLTDDAFRAVLAISANHARRLADLELDPTLRLPPEVPDSPLELAHLARHPFHLSWGGEDRPPVMQSGEAMVAALRATGVPVSHHVMPGADHFSIHLETRDPADPWIRRLAEMLSFPPG